MKIFSIYDKEFKKYGRVLAGNNCAEMGYDFTELLKKLKKQPIPDKGIVYKASVKELEDCNATKHMQIRGFGGMPIQVGYVGGKNKSLNCLEYHKSSEFNIALDDVVLLLGKQEQIENGQYNTVKCRAFLVPAGCGVELYATTLHYAPINIHDEGYRVICVLPKGTNGEKTIFKVAELEDKMYAGINKWLLAHKDSEEARNGVYIGLIGKNITLK